MLKIGMEYPEMNTKKPHRFRNSHFAQISIFLVILFFAPGAEISNAIYKGFPYKLYCELRGRVEETKILKISKFEQNERRCSITFSLYSHEVTSYHF